MSEREYELYPEPTPEEREALIRAIERHLAGAARTPAAYLSAWRERAILEAVGLAQATARPRRSPGASRA